MKKTYIIPNVLIVELGARNPLMSVSYGDNENTINSMSFDKTDAYAGSSQLTKESKSLWDNEW